MYHEYGHVINGNLYNGMDNHSLNEGIADVWAYAITDDLLLGENWLNS
ncbi:MAG: hypothetical protein H6765_01855 [Candidatus Peribacteria bacterium]|nr:MAG: hypothetical protein H6765_01855 [Candidatus Peribacteria bacterium]